MEKKSPTRIERPIKNEEQPKRDLATVVSALERLLHGPKVDNYIDDLIDGIFTVDFTVTALADKTIEIKMRVHENAEVHWRKANQGDHKFPLILDPRTRKITLPEFNPLAFEEEGEEIIGELFEQIQNAINAITEADIDNAIAENKAYEERRAQRGYPVNKK